MLHVEHLWKKVLVTFLTLFALGFILRPDMGKFLLNPIKERLVYLNVSRGTILSNWLLGVGSGQFVLGMQKYASNTLENWQFQPVHNVFLLIWSELGLIGLGLFIWLLWSLFHPSCKENVPRLPRRLFHVEQFYWGGTIKIVFKAILLGFIFIMLFDHYFWDIQQGQIILWMIMGLLAGESTT